MQLVYQNGNVNNPNQPMNPAQAQNVEVVEFYHPEVDTFAEGLAQRTVERVAGDAIAFFNKDKDEKTTLENVDESYPFASEDETGLLENLCNFVGKLFNLDDETKNNPFKEITDTIDVISEANPNMGKKLYGILHEDFLNNKAEAEGVNIYESPRPMIFGLA